ncbi:MAG: hypothetical protein M0Q12_13910 [Synergistaceae bacterium]|jgi:glutamyl-tRNA reductase|nr:hypothetical protein [Synergistaceae bacterium]
MSNETDRVEKLLNLLEKQSEKFDALIAKTEETSKKKIIEDPTDQAKKKSDKDESDFIQLMKDINEVK